MCRDRRMVGVACVVCDTTGLVEKNHPACGLGTPGGAIWAIMAGLWPLSQRTGNPDRPCHQSST